MGYRRRRNPTSKWGQALVNVFMGVVTGAVGYGMNYGVEYIPVAPVWRTAIFGGGGLLAALGLAKWGSPVLGAGLGAVVGGFTVGRVVTIVKMNQVAPSSATKEGGAVFSRQNPRSMHGRGAGRVYARDSGAVFQRDAGAATTMRLPVFGRGFKEAGASRYVAAPVRFFGPQSWAYDAGSRRVVNYVSAHNQRK